MEPLSDFFFPIVTFHEQALGANAYISKARDAKGIVRGYRIFQIGYKENLHAQPEVGYDKASQAADKQ